MVGKRVLVTGASKGIGRAACERLHEDGYAVVGLARSKPADWPQAVEFHSVDLSDREALQDFLAQPVMQQPFYGLVNNVGLVRKGLLAQVSQQDIYQAVQLNIEVAIVLTQALAPAMCAAGLGRIVNIASRAALGKSSRTVYSMTKAGMIGMGRTWALEMAAAGVTVNSIAPGPIATDFFHGANDPAAASTQALLASIPVGRMGQAQDVAHAIAYFLDERSGFVTGQTHFVCGGMTVSAG